MQKSERIERNTNEMTLFIGKRLACHTRKFISEEE